MLKFFNSLNNSGDTSSKLDLYVVFGGQSNALGRTDGVSPSAGLLGDIEGAYRYNGTDYVTLNYSDYVNDVDGNLFGGELSLSKELVDSGIGNIYFHKRGIAIGGAAIWDDGTAKTFNVAANELIIPLRDAVSTLKAAYDANPNPNKKFILTWIQGETDAIDNKPNEYYQNFEDIINDIEAIKTFDLVVLNLLNQSASLGGGLSGVRNAQQNWVNDNNSKARAIDMNPYTLRADNIHFTGAAQENIGTDLFNIIKKALGY